MFDQYVDFGKRSLEYLKRYEQIASKIKSLVREKFKGARVYLFGSVLTGEVTAVSDIDILIVCDIDRSEAIKLKADIIKKIGLDVPVEIHIATRDEFNNWYRRFIDEMREV